MSSQASATSAAKRRQLHPLRQTSFPAAVNASAIDSAVTPSGARSETGSVANSTFSTTSSKVPGKRGRPKKHAAPQSAKDDGDAGNRKNKDAKSVVSAKSAGGGGGGGGGAAAAPGEASDLEGDEDEDDEDADDLEITADQKQREMVQEKARAEQERKFATVLKGDKLDRYNVQRGFRFESKHVRRIVNQVMSQSSSEKVVNEVLWSSKLFAARIIEGARDVQREWAKGYETVRQEEARWRKEEFGRLEKKREDGKGLGETERVLLTRDIERLRKESELYIPNPHRAGLLPDHIRESLRRYKANGEGYGAGMQGTSHSLLGTTGSAAYRVGDGTSGRRLFR
jgi:transcription initiation factor TFIID subunit 11